MARINKAYDCPISETLTIISGKWKWIIIYYLSKQEVIRYNQIKNSLPTIAHRTLSQQLKELETDGIILREQYNQIPPKVEYSLTEKGKTLIPILNLMYDWGKNNC
jgi:DNA-binding HxlR family transcriptional regulator